MKYLNKFNSWTDYRAKVTDKSAARVTLVENEVIINPASDAWFGDIVYFDKRDGKYKYSTLGGYNECYRNIAQLIPIGVVTVPARYTPDGVPRIVSLVNMSVKTPDVGTIANGTNSDNTGDMSMYWGGNGVDLEGLTNYKWCNKVNPPTGEFIDNDHWMEIPANISSLSGSVDPVSGHRYYNTYDPDDEDASYGPSPFLADGSKSLFYFEGRFLMHEELDIATNDFDGKGNSKVILDAVTEASWKTKSTITNGYGAGNYPAAETCWRYTTEGTQHGDWYLPAIGELAFLWVERDKISSSINAIQSFGITRAYNIPTSWSAVTGGWCWASSEYSSEYAWSLTLDFGSLSSDGKNNANTHNRVRAFSALNPLKL